MFKTKLSLAAAVVAVLAFGSVADRADAGPAGPMSTPPRLEAVSSPLLTPAAWRIYTRWHNGCHRWRVCNNRYWNGYKWKYNQCYWGGCSGGSYGGGGRGY